MEQGLSCGTKFRPPFTMSRPPEPDLRRLILDTTRQLLTSDGYASLSMRRIARQIGYSATSIYLHYENKDQLVHALIDEGVEMLHDLLEREVVPGQPEATLRALCAAYARFGLEHPEYYEIMYILHTEYIERYPAEKYRRARQNLEFFARALTEGAAQGLFDGVDPLLGSTSIWAQLHGVVNLMNGHRIDRKIPHERLLEEVIERIVRSQKPEIKRESFE